MLNKIDFVIKTFERYLSLGELLESIYKYYPDVDVYICDDSENINHAFYAEWFKRLNIILITSEFDIGLSAGRNMLIDKSKSPYIFLLDDDFVFTEETKVEKLLSVLESDEDIVIAGGTTIHDGEEEHYEFDIKIDGMNVEKVPIEGSRFFADGVKYYLSDSVLNFALFERRLFNYIKWDEELKLSEHFDFYLNLKRLNKFKVAWVPEVRVLHNKKRNEKYRKFRIRGNEFMLISFIKNGVQNMTDLNGYMYSVVIVDGKHKLKITKIQ